MTSSQILGFTQEATYRWTDTKVEGFLQLVYVDYNDIKDRKVTIPPLMIVRILNPLSMVLFEHELPLNMKVDSDQGNLVAFSTVNGQYIGMYFKNKDD